MPGLPKKYAKMGFKKGWRAFKATKKSPKKKIKSLSKKGNTMPKEKRKIVRRSRKRYSAKRGNPGHSRPVTVLGQGLAVAGGTVGSGALMNLVPVVRTLPAWGKLLAQALSGMTVYRMSRTKTGKMVGIGIISGGGVTLLNSMLPFGGSGTAVSGLGYKRPLTRSEIQSMNGGTQNGNGYKLARPYEIGKPITIGKPYTIGAGVTGGQSYRANF